jgi:benzoate/toluate 1,2-dioxygenase alpha subunit
MITREALEQLDGKLDRWFRRSAGSPAFQIDQEMFTDPVLFELEMDYIFERNWVFVGHDSQLPKANDYLTTFVGRVPVVLTRTAGGEVKCFVNSCTHRGARLCRQKRGNQKFFACGFHGWTFSSAGELVEVAAEEEGGYPADFDKKKLGLHPVRLESYQGFLFASLSDDVVPLTEYLGDSKTFIDMLAQQSPEGKIEVLPGATRYKYHGNWKLQTENGVDGYHVPAVHANYIMTTMRRATGESSNKTKVGVASGRGPSRLTGGGVGTGGYLSFRNGHQALWLVSGAPDVRANYAMRPMIAAKYGEDRARLLNETSRNLLVYPNVFVMDQAGMQIRIIRPISVAETEIISYSIAPVGEPAEVRELRIRQFEDFMNASGMATPDDLAEFNECQTGFGDGGRFSDISRGASRWAKGVGEHGRQIGIRDAVGSSEASADEGLFLALHESWLERVKAAVANAAAELEGRESMVMRAKAAE